MTVRLYVEGGGDSKRLKTQCRRGFRKFIEKAGLQGRMPRIVACGGRQRAYDSFATALDAGTSTPMLLVDAERRVTDSSAWEHLRKRDGWSRPGRAHENQCHLMVQVMESWFLADRGTLKAFYGPGFHEESLPSDPSIERIVKADVLDGLARATRKTSKGPYDKGPTSFDILAEVDPSKVERSAPHAKRFLDTLRAGSQG
ncbi:MAG: DUF4276 family protein [Gemmatimonadota bacterium]|nr:DUF4276 family protein [Gemmatimonadota bacterium]